MLNPEGMFTGLHTNPKIGYVLELGAGQNRDLRGHRNLHKARRKPLKLKVGKTYRCSFALKGKKLTYKCNGKTLFKQKDPVPLTWGHASLGAWGRAVFDDLVIEGTPRAEWLAEMICTFGAKIVSLPISTPLIPCT